MERKRLVIIDGYSLLFRAFYGTRFLSTSDGKPTNALFGFVSMLFELFQREHPDCIVVALDAHAPTFRHEEYEAYKGTRKETPPELVEQLIESRALLEALHIPTLELNGYEADDIVGTLSLDAESRGYHTTIVTGDLDSLQLVDHCVSVMTTRRGVSDVVIYDPEAVKERYGFGPEYITDYKALVGDTSDNIPGVPGIGEKSATILIQKFGPIEQILERLEEVDEKFRKKIEPNIEQLKKSKWLATIHRTVPLQFGYDHYQITESQLASSIAKLTEYEFRSHTKKLPQIMAPYMEGADHTSRTAVVEIRTESLEPRVFAAAKSESELFAWVNGNDFGLHFPAGSGQLSLIDEAQQAVAWVAVGSDVRQAPVSIAHALLRERTNKAILHDAKSALKQAKSGLSPVGMDTMLAAYVLQPGRSHYQLSDLAQAYLDVSPPQSPEEMAVAMTNLTPALREKLDKEGQRKVLEEVELPLMPILAEMEELGIELSTGFLSDFSKSLQVAIEASSSKIFAMAGREFLIASPKQLGEVLFDELGLPSDRKTKTGYATGAEVLSNLQAEYPIAGEVLTWRELTKLKSTYSDALPRMVGSDGRIHTSFNQTVAATGRLSSNDPNLQNIPIRTELGRQIRRAFVAGAGYRLFSFDYSQIELRLLAHLCKDDALVEAFQSGVDVHTVTASQMFGIDTQDVSKEQRRLAKMLNYAVLYGVTDFGLANQLGEGFSNSAAKELITKYNERFPSVKGYTQSVVEEARSKGYTTTLIGRRRYFPEIHAANRAERLYAERQAMNAPIQGSAADMIKIAMLHVRKDLGAGPVRMLLQVHDELVFEVPDGRSDEIEPIRIDMERALPLDVPIEVDAKQGANWAEMTPV